MTRISSRPEMPGSEPLPRGKRPPSGRPLPPIPPRPQGPQKMPQGAKPAQVLRGQSADPSRRAPPPRPARNADAVASKLLGVRESTPPPKTAEQVAQSTYVGEFFGTENDFKRDIETYLNVMDKAKLTPQEKKLLGYEELRAIKSNSEAILSHAWSRSGMKEALKDPKMLEGILKYSHNYHPVRLPAMQKLEAKLKPHFPPGVDRVADLGIKPLQRAPKYELLLRETMKRESIDSLDVAKLHGERMKGFNANHSTITDSKEYRDTIRSIKLELNKLTGAGDLKGIKQLERAVAQVDRALVSCSKVGFAVSRERSQLQGIRKTYIASLKREGTAHLEKHRQTLRKEYSKIIPENIQKTGEAEDFASKVKEPRKSLLQSQELLKKMQISNEVHPNYQTQLDIVTLHQFSEALEKRISSANG